MASGHPSIQDPASIPEEFDDPLDHKALAFQYIEETYTLWLDLQDDFTEMNQIMEERYRECSSSARFMMTHQELREEE
jgi:kinetochore protein NDC80